MATVVKTKERIKQNVLGMAIFGIYEATSKYSDPERTIRGVRSILYFTDEIIKDLDWLEEPEKKGIKEEEICEKPKEV